MVIGERFRALREQKKFLQGEIEKKTVLLRCYVSRIENGHAVPALKALEKFAGALDVPMCELCYEGEEALRPLKLPKRKLAGIGLWGKSSNDARMLAKLHRLFSGMKEGDLKLILFTARKWQMGRKAM